MKPPICEFCGKDFRAAIGEGSTVRFANYEPLPDGKVGHPKGLAWFCGKHLEQARSLQERPLSVALQMMGDMEK